MKGKLFLSRNDGLIDLHSNFYKTETFGSTVVNYTKSNGDNKNIILANIVFLYGGTT
jgi:hypothetical protein